MSTDNKRKRPARGSRPTKLRLERLPKLADDNRPATLQQQYPAIAHWVNACGYIEIGDDALQPSMARALDIGGMIWEGRQSYASLDDLFHDLETGISAYLKEINRPGKLLARTKPTAKKSKR